MRDQAKFEQFSVFETANRQPLEDGDPLNSATALSEEATRIQQNYTQQVLSSTDASEHGAGAAALKVDMEPVEYWNPAEHPGKTMASVAYRYRKVRGCCCCA